VSAQRILHFPTDVGGHPSALSAGERALGLTSDVAVLRPSWLRYPVDIDLGVRDGSKVADLSGRLRFMAKAVRRYDVFHFNFGQSFLPGLRDLRWLRRMGKKVFVTFQGCDARQQSVCARKFAISCCGQGSGPDLCDPSRDRAKANVVARACRDAHRVFAVNPDLLHVIPDGVFVPYAVAWGDEVTAPRTEGPIRIFHAPTNRAVKGTEHVLAAIEALRSRFDIELHLIENLEHEAALERYRQADLVIDQLKVGWYGAFAVEAMAMGKPVVAYIREDDVGFLPPGFADDLPVVGAQPETLTEVLAGLLGDRQRLRELGVRSRAFVERWHDPRTIARGLAALYDQPDGVFRAAPLAAAP